MREQESVFKIESKLPQLGAESKKGEGLESKEVAKDLVNKENQLANLLHDSIASFLRTSKKKVPRLALVGLAAAKLFFIETAIAADIGEQQENGKALIDQFEVAYGDIELTNDDKNTVSEYLSSGSINFVSAIGNKNFELSPDFLQTAKIPIFNEPIDLIYLSRSVPVETIGQLTKESDWKVVEGVFDGQKKSHLAIKDLKDFWGNQTSVVWRWVDGQTSGREEIFVQPKIFYNDKNDSEDEMSFIRLDLSPVGLKDLNLLYQPSLKEQTDFDGVPVYVKHRELEKLFLTYQVQLETGVEQTFADFDLSVKDAVKRIVIRQSGDVQIKVGGWWGLANLGKDEVYFAEEMLESADSTLIQPEHLESVADHESLHMIGEFTGVHNAPEWERQFLLGSVEVLKQLNEQNFTDTGNGHAQDDQFELFASLLNSVDVPNWQEGIEKLTPEAHQYYFESLTLARKLLVEKGINPNCNTIRNIDSKLIWH